MTLIDTTTQGQSGPVSNVNEWVLYYPQDCKIGIIVLSALFSHIGKGGVMVKALDCATIVRDFEPQWRY